MHSIHPTLHDLARASAPPPPVRHHHRARHSLRARRDLALLQVGTATIRLGLRLGEAGRVRRATGHGGRPPDTHPVT